MSQRKGRMRVTEEVADEPLSLTECHPPYPVQFEAARASGPDRRASVAIVCRPGGDYGGFAATLRLHGFFAETLSPAEPDRIAAGVGRHDVVLLEYPLTGDESWMTLRAIQRMDAPPPVIVVSQRSDSVDRTVGLEIGADDYVDSTCPTRELLARVRAVLRRRAPPSPSRQAESPPAARPAAIARFGQWEADLHRRRLLHDGSPVTGLTSTDHQLLAIFLRQPQQVISRETLMETLHGPGLSGQLRTIDVCISRLRRKLDRTNEELIRTVRSRGYIFLPEVRWHG